MRLTDEPGTIKGFTLTLDQCLHKDTNVRSLWNLYYVHLLLGLCIYISD